MLVTYVAGPYSSKSVAGIKKNILTAEEYGMRIATELKIMPLMPHTNTAFWDDLMPAEFFYHGTLELMKRCDAVAVVPSYSGGSKGVDFEISTAVKLGIPVFRTFNNLKHWVDTLKQKGKAWEIQL